MTPSPHQCSASVDNKAIRSSEDRAPLHSERDSSALSNLMGQLEVRSELDHFIRRRPGLCWPSRDQGVEGLEHRVLGREVTLSGYCSQLYHLQIIPRPRDRMSGGEAMIWTVL